MSVQISFIVKNDEKPEAKIVFEQTKFGNFKINVEAKNGEFYISHQQMAELGSLFIALTNENSVDWENCDDSIDEFRLKLKKRLTKMLGGNRGF